MGNGLVDQYEGDKYVDDGVKEGGSFENYN